MRGFKERMMNEPFYLKNKQFLESYSILSAFVNEERTKGVKKMWVGDPKFISWMLPLMLIINLFKIIIIIKSIFIIYCVMDLPQYFLSQLVVNLLIGLIVLRQLIIGWKCKVEESKLGGVAEYKTHKFLDLGRRVGLICQTNSNNFHEN